MQHAVHGHTGDWAQGLPHAKRMWYHYTMCPWVTAFIASEIAKHAAAGFHADSLSQEGGIPAQIQSTTKAELKAAAKCKSAKKEAVSVEGAGGRKKSFSSQLACSMLCMDTLGIEPRGCTHPSNGHTSPTLRKGGRDDLAHGHTGDWAQGLLHAKRMYTSQQWPHESYTEKMGAGWFRAFFWTRTSQ